MASRTRPWTTHGTQHRSASPRQGLYQALSRTRTPSQISATTVSDWGLAATLTSCRITRRCRTHPSCPTLRASPHPCRPKAPSTSPPCPMVSLFSPPANNTAPCQQLLIAASRAHHPRQRLNPAPVVLQVPVGLLAIVEPNPPTPPLAIHRAGTREAVS